MGKVHPDVPEDQHTELHNIKNNEDDRPDTIEGCVLEAISMYVDEFGDDDE